MSGFIVHPPRPLKVAQQAAMAATLDAYMQRLQAQGFGGMDLWHAYNTLRHEMEFFLLAQEIERKLRDQADMLYECTKHFEACSPEVRELLR